MIAVHSVNTSTDHQTTRTLPIRSESQLLILLKPYPVKTAGEGCAVGILERDFSTITRYRWRQRRPVAISQAVLVFQRVGSAVDAGHGEGKVRPGRPDTSNLDEGRRIRAGAATGISLGDGHGVNVPAGAAKAVGGIRPQAPFELDTLPRCGGGQINGRGDETTGSAAPDSPPIQRVIVGDVNRAVNPFSSSFFVLQYFILLDKPKNNCSKVHYSTFQMCRLPMSVNLAILF